MHEPGRGGGSAAAPLPAARLRSSSPSLLPGLPGPEVREGAGQGGSVGIQNGMYSTPSILGVPFSASHPANLPQTHSEHPTKAQSLRESMWGRIQHRAAVPHCPAEDFPLFFCPFGTWGCCLQCWRFCYLFSHLPQLTAGAGHQHSSSELIPGPVSPRICQGAGTGMPVMLRTPPSTGSSLGQMAGCL